MGQRRAGHDKRCPNCRINQLLCVCEFIQPLSITTKISLIVHVRELKLTSNTAQFAAKMLPDQCQLYIRGRVFEKFDPTELLRDQSSTPLFMYPHEDALELNEEFKKMIPGPYHLIIPDGNWQQARKVRNREPQFKNLTAVKLPPGISGEYRLRKANHSHWVSTYEAMAHALGLLESQETRDHLMNFFRIWVNRTLEARY